MTHFLNVDEVKEETKIIVSGFIGKCQCLFDSDNPYYNIPELVTRIIISYFAHIEYFESKSDKLSLDTTKRRVIKEAIGGYGSAYGHVCIDGNIDKSIHRWVLEIVEDNDICDIYFGIDGSENKQCDFYPGDEIDQYGINDGTFEYCSDSDDDALEVYGGAPDLKKGDTITMELNCAEKSLNYHVNEQEQKCGYNNICLQDKKYVMTISLSYLPGNGVAR